MARLVLLVVDSLSAAVSANGGHVLVRAAVLPDLVLFTVGITTLPSHGFPPSSVKPGNM